jgi:hypothetical protein
MGQIAHLSHIGQYLSMHYLFFCDHYKQFQLTCNGGHCLRIREAYTSDLEVGISTVLEIIGHFLFKGECP